MKPIVSSPLDFVFQNSIVHLTRRGARTAVELGAPARPGRVACPRQQRDATGVQGAAMSPLVAARRRETPAWMPRPQAYQLRLMKSLAKRAKAMGYKLVPETA